MGLGVPAAQSQNPGLKPQAFYGPLRGGMVLGFSPSTTRATLLFGGAGKADIPPQHTHTTWTPPAWTP